jgi:3-deoxy-manno-octulosonate cytidylyltransferase (CMP-KDO synthetase)
VNTLDLSEWLVVVPARLGSQRLPRKPLADLGGRPLIVRVIDNLKPLRDLGALVLCATDAEEVLATVKHWGYQGMLTADTHLSGTDRCAEVAQQYPKPFVLNVQGDEPFVDCDDLTKLCKVLQKDKAAHMVTLVHRSQERDRFFDPNVVKVVASEAFHALYFSRAPIPFDREQGFPGSFWQHIGVYGFQRQKLLEFPGLGQAAAQPSLETIEKLEQLRVLGAGWKIALSVAKGVARGIDTFEDLKAARQRFES